jgi:hypothetical protein
MPNATVEMLHHQTLRYYRHELATLPEGARRTLLLSLMAQAKTSAEEHGWSVTSDYDLTPKPAP